MIRKLALLAVALGILAACDPVPVGQPSNTWTLAWADEFNGSSLDASKWNDGWFGTINGSTYTHPVNGLEDGCFDQNLSNVSGGYLRLGSGTNSDPDCERRDGTTAPYRGSSVDTRDKFETTYGYFEARMFVPGGEGGCWNWPAWWTDGAALDWPRSGEIDVMECLSDHRAHWHYHYEKNGVEQKPGGANFDAVGWHTYGMEWASGRLRFFYDGTQVGEWTDGVISQDHFLVLGNQINEAYGVHVPAEVQVDYVRVWKHN